MDCDSESEHLTCLVSSQTPFFFLICILKYSDYIDKDIILIFFE